MNKRAVAHATITSQRNTTIARITPYAITAISNEPNARATFLTAVQSIRMAWLAWWCVYIQLNSMLICHRSFVAYVDVCVQACILFHIPCYFPHYCNTLYALSLTGLLISAFGCSSIRNHYFLYINCRKRSGKIDAITM